jgi:hypothetical protein
LGKGGGGSEQERDVGGGGRERKWGGGVREGGRDSEGEGASKREMGRESKRG